MKNKFFYKFITVIILLLFFKFPAYSDQFNFDVKEIEILNNGNLYKGLKRGVIKTNDGIIIQADTFIYNKITNVIDVEGNVKIEDEINKFKIFSNEATYKKNEEEILTNGNSKAIDQKNRVITANNFIYNKITNVIDAEGSAQIVDLSDNYIVKSEKLTFFKNEEKIITNGSTHSKIDNKYEVTSKDVQFLLKEKKLSSKKYSTIKDNNNQIYHLDEFILFTDKKILKGINILTITNYNLPKSDKFYFSEGIFNLENKNFTAKDTKINIHKNIFDVLENDPRVYGVSSSGDGNLTTINKGIFTSCQIRDGCSPWSIKSRKIEHDKEKKQISYENAVLNIYDVPVLYFPKFFHPDPSVERQSGFLKPEINKSNVLGSSFTQPYFKVIDDDKDFTFSPTWFDNKILSLQNEYRQSNKNSEFWADIGFIKGYKSSTTKEKNNMSHIFGRYNINLNLNDFESSNLELSIEQVSNDTYLKVFNDHITKSEARPSNLDVMENHLKLNLNHKNYNFESGFQAFEKLTEANSSDRYQYILPYYNYDTVFKKEYYNGSISFSSSGSNNLNNTNNLKSNIINDLNYTRSNYLFNYGLINNLNINLKNLNSLGKKDSNYKSSPQIEFVSLFETNASFPLIKEELDYNNYLTPKISLRFNPSDMKDNSTSSNQVDTDNIFSLNRLGLSDTFESGRSMTIGIDYKREKINSLNKENEKQNLNDINNFFEIKLATVIRDKKENHISTSSTLNRKNSNIFGSITNNFSNNFKLGYNFAIDNDLSTFEYNDINATLKFKNLETTFNFIEENGEKGDSNIFENSIAYNLDENNSLTFKTRRNRKINLTEYYDLVYEYKNDCLVAGIKYKKSYYNDRDLKPTENLLFTITLFPLTTYEYAADDLVSD